MDPKKWREAAKLNAKLQGDVPGTRQHGPRKKSSVKARPHYKSPGQIGGATWPSGGLVEQLKSSDANDKPSSFITSNEVDQLCHPVQLNSGKRQRKANRLRRLRFFSAAIFIIYYHLPQIIITGPSNSRYCVFVKHF